MIHSMIKSVYWLLWFICSTLTLTCFCYADTSELSIAIESGNAWRSQQSSLDSNQEDWFIDDSDRLATSYLLSGRIGLGLSFETEVWIRGTAERLGEIELNHRLKDRDLRRGTPLP